MLSTCQETMYVLPNSSRRDFKYALKVFWCVTVLKPLTFFQVEALWGLVEDVLVDV